MEPSSWSTLTLLKQTATGMYGPPEPPVSTAVFLILADHSQTHKSVILLPDISTRVVRSQ